MASPPDKEGKRKKLVQDALAQFRATRSQIAPELLEQMRSLIVRQGEPAQSPPPAVAAKPIEKPSPGIAAGDVAIDRTRNLSVIMKFLELKAGDKDLNREIRDLFKKSLH